MSEQTAVINSSGGGVAFVTIVVLIVLVLIGASVFFVGGRSIDPSTIEMNANPSAQQSPAQ